MKPSYAPTKMRPCRNHLSPQGRTGTLPWPNKGPGGNNGDRKAETDGGPGQAVLHKADGQIKEERTYGKDPRQHPG
jgi:hypothetical protein